VKQVFVDTSGFFAFLVGNDTFHAHARSLFEQASADNWELITTNIVMIETHALLLVRTRDGRRNAIEFVDQIRRPPFRIERITEQDEGAAIDLLRAHEDKAYSLCDALSFVVMERLDIADAIAFDTHFRQYGSFTVL
jgi:predicted nucleic acid-binding protein